LSAFQTGLQHAALVSLPTFATVFVTEMNFPPGDMFAEMHLVCATAHLHGVAQISV